MNIHGTRKIRRRSPIDNKHSYNDYRTELREDFRSICGYCGKHEMVSGRGMEIDHFVPISVNGECKNDHENLVY